MKTIVTHSGGFHSDDVFAVATLQILLDGEEMNIIRTRDNETIAAADYVVDVGGIHDPKMQRFDHHQMGAPVRNSGLPYAAFGLVWQAYGSQLTGDADIAAEIERQLVVPIDAGDNGINLYDLKDKDLAPYELYQMVGSFAPPWQSGKSKDECFLQAVAFARGLIERTIAQQQAFAAMKKMVADTYEQANDRTVLVFGVPVSANALIDYEEVKIVVCPDDPDSNDNWTATAVRKEHGSFASRVSFPESWRGLRDQELASVSGIADAVFCHKAGFIFVAGSREGVLAATGRVN